jgi:hypothetical protein
MMTLSSVLHVLNIITLLPCMPLLTHQKIGAHTLHILPHIWLILTTSPWKRKQLLLSKLLLVAEQQWNPSDRWSQFEQNQHFILTTDNRQPGDFCQWHLWSLFLSSSFLFLLFLIYIKLFSGRIFHFNTKDGCWALTLLLLHIWLSRYVTCTLEG